MPKLYATPASGQQPKQLALKTVLKQLEDKYTVNFGYNDQAIEDKFVEANIGENKALETSLQRLLTPLALDYQKINDSFYIIAIKSKSSYDRRGRDQRAFGHKPDIGT